MKKYLFLFLFLLSVPVLADTPVTVDTSKLEKLARGLEVGKPVKTPVDGLYQVRIGNQYAYISESGDYAFIGNLFDLKQGIDLTKQAQAGVARQKLAAFPEDDMIIFPAEGKEIGEITVFSDTSCPYCRKLHQEIPVIQKSGISVRYIPFPRGKEKGKGYAQMLSVWCAEDRQKAMNIANGVIDADLEEKSCDSEKIINAGYELGLAAGVNGTPSVFLTDGTHIGGYLPANNIVKQVKKLSAKN